MAVDQVLPRHRTPSDSAVLRKLHFLYGTSKRQLEYKYEYVHAARQWKTLERLGPIIEKTFDDEWVDTVDLRLRPRWGIDIGSHASIFWDAPVAVRVFRKSEHGGVPAFCLALHVTRDQMWIRQLQGIQGITVPARLKKWPLKFVQSCQTFAEQENYASIHLLSARSRREWWKPTQLKAAPEGVDQAVEQLRERLKIRYDVTAQKLGFSAQENWFVWTNPNFKEKRSLIKTSSWWFAAKIARNDALS